MLAIMKDIVVKIQAAVFCQPGHHIFAGSPSAHGVMLVVRHAFKAHYFIIVIVAQPVHQIRAGDPYPDNCYPHLYLLVLEVHAIKT
jgi:hypothetical protein